MFNMQYLNMFKISISGHLNCIICLLKIVSVEVIVFQHINIGFLCCKYNSHLFNDINISTTPWVK